MGGITRIKWKNGLKVDNSERLEDKGDTYRAFFGEQVYDVNYVSKKLLSERRIYKECGTWCNVLYLSTEQYNQDKNYWIKKVKEWREPSDNRTNWLKSK